jgi:hypothetical protein
MKGIEMDPDFFDAATLTLFCEAIIVNDWVRGAALAIRFMEAVSVKSAIHLVLFPTIFENGEWFPEMSEKKVRY